jgi:hypothetical protein
LDKRPGDTVFAWFTPEASHIDNDFIDQLVQREVIPRVFAAAIQTVDVNNPILSARRASLLRHVPDSFTIGTPEAGPAFISEFLRRVRSAGAAVGTPEAEVLALLESANPVDAVNKRVDDYVENVQAQLVTDRNAALSEMLQTLLRRRQTVLSDPKLGALDESRSLLLFPMPSRDK